jgi:hypothetical protein
MALKIITQIGTDKGITSEAYVRIADYQVSKYGSANFRIELFESKPEVHISGPIAQTMTTQARNQQIGDNMWVELSKEVATTSIVNKLVRVFVQTVLAEDGTVITPGTDTWENQDVEETYMVKTPDLSPLETTTIFEFGYSHLKEKLVSLFGAENIVDC